MILFLFISFLTESELHRRESFYYIRNYLWNILFLNILQTMYFISFSNRSIILKYSFEIQLYFAK